MKRNYLIIIALFVIVILGISYFQLSPNLAPRVYCITPPAYPGVINQSGMICPGTYYDGIEIAGNDIHLKCSGSTFVGYSNPNRMNGLLINGSYRNITVEDCIFSVFPENGISLSGPVGVPNPRKLTGVLLKNVTSSQNGEDGLVIRENTYQIDAVGGIYENNSANGIHLISEYKDPLRYRVNPDPYPKYFSNDIRIFNATMLSNQQNGIYVDAEKYYRQQDDMLSENNIIIIAGNVIGLNFENGIKNTDFFVKVLYLNTVAPGAGNYFIAENTIFLNNLAGIKINTAKTQGPLGNEIICDYSSSARISQTNLAISSVNYIFWNIIDGNKNGIEATIDSSSTPNSFNSCEPSYSATIYQAIANRIRNNQESGVLYSLKEPMPLSGTTSDFSSIIGGYGGTYYQNIISSNGNSGVFFNGSSSTAIIGSTRRSSEITLICNDIISNRDYGIRVTGRNNPLLKEDAVSLRSIQDIIEHNTVGGVYLDYIAAVAAFQAPNIGSDYIGNHPAFNIYNGVLGVNQLAWVRGNDFVNSPVLAHDVGSDIDWSENYWDDYSPTCVDQNPRDGYCDVPRPIPTSNQDIRPKAGAPWGNNLRGYLQLDQGILLSQCPVQIPQYPIRPTPPQGGSIEPKEPEPRGGGEIPPINPGEP